MTVNDKRRFTRVPFDAEVMLHFGTVDWPSDLIDISLKGMLIVLPDGFDIPVGSSVNVDVNLNDEVSIETTCMLMHRTQDRLGLRIDRIDMESIIHLRRLIELNLGDPELLERELNGLGE